MSSQNTSSDPRVQNSDVAQLDFQGLTITVNRSESDSDKAGPYRESAEGKSDGATVTKTHGELSERNSGKMRASEATNISAAGQNQTTDQIIDQALTNEIEEMFMSSVTSLSEEESRHIAALLREKSYAEVQEELAYHGLSFESFSTDDVSQIIAYAREEF